jgi:hypothetical protein
MHSPELFCGEALCKKAVALPAGYASWPLRCPACGTALYPVDILARTPLNELEPKRAALATKRGGQRRDVTSAELSRPEQARGRAGRDAPAGPSASATTSSDGVDRILAMVDLDAAPPARRHPVLRWGWLGLVAAVLVAIVAFVSTR